MRALPGFFAVLLSIALAIPGRNDGKAGANEVIALARAALGGEAAEEWAIDGWRINPPLEAAAFRRGAFTSGHEGFASP